MSQYKSEHIEIVVGLLLRAGADINIKSNNGSTALHIAVTNHKNKIVVLLLKSGADDSIRNEEEKTAFEVSQKLKRPYGNVNSWQRAVVEPFNDLLFTDIMSIDVDMFERALRDVYLEIKRSKEEEDDNWVEIKDIDSIIPFVNAERNKYSRNELDKQAVKDLTKVSYQKKMYMYERFDDQGYNKEYSYNDIDRYLHDSNFNDEIIILNYYFDDE